MWAAAELALFGVQRADTHVNPGGLAHASAPTGSEYEQAALALARARCVAGAGSVRCASADGLAAAASAAACVSSVSSPPVHDACIDCQAPTPNSRTLSKLRRAMA